MEDKKMILLKDKGAVLMSCSEVFNQFEKFLHHAMKPWVNKYSFDDLYSAASYGLLKAYNTYNADNKILFMTYLATIVNNELLMLNRKERKYLSVISFNEPICTDSDGNKLTIMDLAADETDYEELAIKNVLTGNLDKLLGCLKPKEQEIIKGLYLEELTQKQIADRLNISQSYISRITIKSLNKIKKYYERNGGVKMPEKKITREQLLEEALKYGTGHEAHKIIGEKYGVSHHTIRTYMGTLGISEAIKKMKGEKIQDIPKETIITEADKESIPETKEVITQTNPIETTEIEPRKLLHPVLLRGNVMEYKVRETGYEICNIDSCASLTITTEQLDDFIKELLELKNVG